MDKPVPAPDNAVSPAFSLKPSAGFTGWLAQHGCSIAVTASQVGKLFFFGARPDGGVWVFNRTIGRCQGITAHGNSLWVSADGQIITFADAMAGAGREAGDIHDALYVPRAAFHTGDVDAHDLALGADGRLVFANTLFNCLAAPSLERSFDALWKPPFITRFAPEDRCHLNGIAMRGGVPTHVSVIAASDSRDGWRQQRGSGGQIIDIGSGGAVCTGLSMPHSPRWHGDRLWLLNSGTGEFGYADLGRGRFEAVAFCPGYLRGLSFIGDFAVLGLSRPRGNGTFSGLALDAALERHRADPVCGLHVIDLRSGAAVHRLDVEGVVTELHDVAVLPGKMRPAAMGPNSPDARRMIVL